MLTRISRRATLANMKIDIPKREPAATKIVSVRFSPDEYSRLETTARKSGVPIATMLRVVGKQIISGDIVVN